MRCDAPPAPRRGFGSRLAGDSLVYGLGGMANQAVAVLLVPIYAGVLGPPGVGVTGVLNSTISLGLMITGLALPQAFFRWYLRESTTHAARAHVLGTTLAIRVAASLLGFALMLLAALPLTGVMYDGEHLLVFALAGPVVLFDTLNAIPLSYLRAERRPRDYVVISLARAVVGTVLIVTLVVIADRGVLGVALGAALASALSAGIGMAALARAGMLRIAWDPALTRAMLTFALPLVPAGIAGWALNLADRPLLRAITGSDALVGVYTTGYTAGLVINALVIQPFTLSWSATFWEIARTDDAARTFSRSLNWFLALAAGLALFLSVIGTDVIRLLFPPTFEQSRYIVPFSAFSYVLYGAYTIAATGLSIVGRTASAATTMVAAATATLVLNLALIPVYGMYGAAIATLAGYTMLAVLAGWASQRHYPVPWQIGRAAAILLVAGGLSALALIGPDHVLWRIGCLLLYPPILVGAGIVRATQARQLIEAIRRR